MKRKFIYNNNNINWYFTITIICKYDSHWQSKIIYENFQSRSKISIEFGRPSDSSALHRPLKLTCSRLKSAKSRKTGDSTLAVPGREKKFSPGRARERIRCSSNRKILTRSHRCREPRGSQTATSETRRIT